MDCSMPGFSVLHHLPEFKLYICLHLISSPSPPWVSLSRGNCQTSGGIFASHICEFHVYSSKCTYSLLEDVYPSICQENSRFHLKKERSEGSNRPALPQGLRNCSHSSGWWLLLIGPQGNKHLFPSGRGKLCSHVSTITLENTWSEVQ